MIKIQYSDLPGGLHVRADAQGRNTILYLLPGLTQAQRKAAIRRARSAARVGHGPGLPALAVARALATDRIRTTVRNGLAAMRVHPAICFPPMIIIVGAAVAYLLLVSVSVRFYPPHTAAPPIVVGIHEGGGPLHRGGTRNPAGGPPASGAAPGSPGSPAGTPPGRRPGSSRSPGQAPSPAPSRPRDPSSPNPSPSSPAPAPSTAPSPAPSTSPGPGSGSGNGGVCVKVGPLGVCIGL